LHPSNSTGGIHYNENQYATKKNTDREVKGVRRKQQWIRGVRETDKEWRDYY
jgi:hypothetical protein